jgi:NADPH:quinone reductase-like Zn-dependent oxidoreductase
MAEGTSMREESGRFAGLSGDGSPASIRPGSTMMAIVQDTYGPPTDVLALEEIPTPRPADDEVLVRVRAASVHIGDCYLSSGVPYLMRPVFGLRRPRHRVPGTDVAGEVAAIGGSVTRFRPGDAVFGWCHGAFAEYVAVPEGSLAAKPVNLGFECAAALGVSAFTALQALRDHGSVRPGTKLLINGASGGVGTFAVQIGKALGAEVTGVCSARNADMVRSIGADHVIDYAEEDFTTGTLRYDVILDNVGSHPLRDTRRALSRGGILLSNGAPIHGWFGGLGRVVLASASSMLLSRQGRPFVSLPDARDLATLKQLVEGGKVTPVIDETYPLGQAAAAIAHVGMGHGRGTTVIRTEASSHNPRPRPDDRAAGGGVRGARAESPEPPLSGGGMNG